MQSYNFLSIFYITFFSFGLIFLLKNSKFYTYFFYLGILSYIFKLIFIFYREHNLPFGNIDGVLSLIGTILIGLFLALSKLYPSLSYNSFIIALLGWIFSLAGLASKLSIPSNPFFILHIIFAALSYAFIIIGGFFSLSKLALEKKLKEKIISKNYIPISTLSKLEKLMINLSFFALTFTLAFAMIWSGYFGSGFYIDKKILITLFIWVYYALLHAYMLRSGKPYNVSLLSAVGTSLTILAVLFIRHSNSIYGIH